MREPTRAAAEAFVQYLYTPEAQAVFAESGFRSWPQTSSLPSAYLMWQKTFRSARQHTGTCSHLRGLYESVYSSALKQSDAYYANAGAVAHGSVTGIGADSPAIYVQANR